MLWGNTVTDAAGSAGIELAASDMPGVWADRMARPEFKGKILT